MLTYLSDDTFETFLNQISNNDSVDLSNVSFIDPYGMVGVLEAGRYLKSGITEKNLILPSSENVLRYLVQECFKGIVRKICQHIIEAGGSVRLSFHLSFL